MLALLAALPGKTFFWLLLPPVVMFAVTLAHSLKHWNRER